MLILTHFSVFFLCKAFFFFLNTEGSKFCLDFQSIVTKRMIISFGLGANKPCGWNCFLDVCVGLCIDFWGFF